MKSGVYVIEHIASGKKYVGSAAKSFSRRWDGHRSHLRKGTHHSKHLQAAWEKYGESEFIFRIVKRTTPEEAIEIEQAFIDLYKSADRKFGYNIAPIAGSSLGVKHSDAARANMSAAKKGHKYSLGVKHTDAAKANMSSAQKGRKHTAATRAKTSASMKGRRTGLGRKYTPEQNAARSVFMKAVWARRKGIVVT